MIFWIFLCVVFCIVGTYAGYTLLCRTAAQRGRTHVKSLYFSSVTLLICAYNEEAVLPKKMEDIAKIDYPEEKLKILFVNDNSTDRTRQVILEAIPESRFEMEVIDSEYPRGKTNALNYAYGRLSTEITFQTDADTFLHPQAVRELVQNFADPNVGGANGAIRIYSSKPEGQLARHEDLYRKFYDLWRKGESAIDSISICNGCIIAFRTALVRDVRLRSMADDTELLFEVIRKGKRVVYDDSALAYETIPTKASERFFQKMRRSKGLFQVYLRNIRLLGKGRFGRIIFPFVLAQICVIPYLFFVGTALYIWLSAMNPLWLLLLVGFFVPKLNTTLLNVGVTQLQLALSPFHRTGAWRMMKSSRDGRSPHPEVGREPR
ncbi:MAG: glycosyltransferase [bacterium]